jgi:superfamily II DNA or RNA helicase
MGIAQKVACEFSDAVRARGQSYLVKGRVSLIAAAPDALMARVRGTESYRVRLRMRSGKLFASCTCPYYGTNGEPCKHLWATILLADARALLPPTPGRPLRLITELPKRQRPTGPGQVGPGELGGYHGAGGYRDANGHRIPNGPMGGMPAHPKGGNRRRARGAPHGEIGYGPVPAGPRDRHQAKAHRAAKAAQQQARAAARRAQIIYVLDVPATLNQNQVVIDVTRRQRRPSGEWGPLRPFWPSSAFGPVRLDPEDRLLMALLDDARVTPSANANGAPASHAPLSLPSAASAGRHRHVLRPEAQVALVERLARSNRLRVRRTEGEEDPPSARWDDGPPWQFGIDIRPADPSGKRWTWRGMLKRGDARMDLAEPLVLLPGLVILGAGRIARFDDAGVFLWMARLRHEKEMTLSEVQQDTMLGRILGESRLGSDDLIDSLRLEEVDLPPRPCLTVRTPRQNWGSDCLIAELEFDYEGARVRSFPPGRVAVQTDRRRAIRRDETAERAAREQLEALGFREARDIRADPGTLELPPKRLAQATKELVQDGWLVEAEGTLIRPASDFKLSVSTGIDWFELDGYVDFGGQAVPLPEILDAARRGESMVTLSDGSMGMLPEDWLKKYGVLAEMGTAEGDHIRFDKTQAGLLDALLAAQPGIRVDAAFEAVRQQLHSFEGVKPLKAPAGFQGELRPYQREGLGWLVYLQEFGFGGILADDMGLGKTIQVLALLLRRKMRAEARGPSLIVVPRSLVFNWLQEAARFTPGLRLLDYTGPNRHALREHFGEYDLVVTTYGTLRTDVVELTQTEFDYVILDEAQAIKNADSQAAKAARLLKGRHRLALSGTPIENHLGELWSIVEFLNPGMLGASSVFKRLTGGAGLDDGAKMLLARALRPFILRRTKQQVVKDLPEKTEQTLYCDLEPAQRQVYENLRAHYRDALLRKGDAEIKKSKIEVLEALLRLRQAACHPALIDPERADEPSAKLDMLLPQLEEVIDEGHKVLVFSQFTSFLAIVRERLEAEGLAYEYLDGRTRNRAERVERFQNDPSIPIFLISLKAGGLGLNLTAAEYVYLLDPWWNPAVEAQAIDRSHRIGQTRSVFAYRLICRDTVEEKILDLQQRKRDLADAILSADKSLIRTLTRDDLEFLLS